MSQLFYQIIGRDGNDSDSETIAGIEHRKGSQLGALDRNDQNMLGRLIEVLTVHILTMPKTR